VCNVGRIAIPRATTAEGFDDGPAGVRVEVEPFFLKRL